jgi:MFS family permease
VTYTLALQELTCSILGPVVGPIAGGFITQNIGFKYIFFTISGLCGLASLIAIPFLKETYAPVIRARRASQMSDPEKPLPPDSQAEPPQDTKLRILWLNLSRPVIMLTRSFICFILSLYMAFIYGCYYMMVRAASQNSFRSRTHHAHHSSLPSQGYTKMSTVLAQQPAVWRTLASGLVSSRRPCLVQSSQIKCTIMYVDSTPCLCDQFHLCAVSSRSIMAVKASPNTEYLL